MLKNFKISGCLSWISVLDFPGCLCCLHLKLPKCQDCCAVCAQKCSNSAPRDAWFSGILVLFAPQNAWFSRISVCCLHPQKVDFQGCLCCLRLKMLKFPGFLRSLHGTRSVLYARELRSFVVVLCPREFWFRSRIFGPFVIWKFKVEDLESSSENLCS